jgi:hypothetical protein
MKLSLASGIRAFFAITIRDKICAEISATHMSSLLRKWVLMETENDDDSLFYFLCFQELK